MAHYESLEQRLFADEQSGCGLDGLPKNNELSGFHIDEFLGVDPHAHHAQFNRKWAVQNSSLHLLFRLGRPPGLAVRPIRRHFA